MKDLNELSRSSFDSIDKFWFIKLRFISCTVYIAQNHWIQI